MHKVNFYFFSLPYYTYIIHLLRGFVNSLQAFWKRFHFCAKVYRLLLLLFARFGHSCPSVRKCPWCADTEGQKYCEKRHFRPGGISQKLYNFSPKNPTELGFSPMKTLTLGENLKFYENKFVKTNFNENVFIIIPGGTTFMKIFENHNI